MDNWVNTAERGSTVSLIILLIITTAIRIILYREWPVLIIIIFRGFSKRTDLQSCPQQVPPTPQYLLSRVRPALAALRL